jgi:hypothetical protein
MNCDLPIWATWTIVVVVLHHVEIGIFGFVYPAGDYSVDLVTYPVVGFLLGLVCLQSTQVLLWWLGACFLMDRLMLVA